MVHMFLATLYRIYMYPSWNFIGLPEFDFNRHQNVGGCNAVCHTIKLIYCPPQYKDRLLRYADFCYKDDVFQRRIFLYHGNLYTSRMASVYCDPSVSFCNTYLTLWKAILTNIRLYIWCGTKMLSNIFLYFAYNFYAEYDRHRCVWHESHFRINPHGLLYTMHLSAVTMGILCNRFCSPSSTSLISSRDRILYVDQSPLSWIGSGLNGQFYWNPSSETQNRCKSKRGNSKPQRIIFVQLICSRNNQKIIVRFKFGNGWMISSRILWWLE